MKTHYIHLHPEPFSLVKNGSKSIECRLNDEKRKTFSVGDQLVFENRGTGEKFFSLITNLYTYDTFPELFESHKPSTYGGTNTEESLQNIQQFYTKEDEMKYGVVGIEFTRIHSEGV
jgi:ASC-1-like (ASCH) protein